MIWDIYVGVAVLAFTVSLLSLIFMIGVEAFTGWLNRRDRAKIEKELREIYQMEETRKYLDTLFNKDKDKKED